MANSGFVSIGHLLFCESSDHDRISILREVCKKLAENFTLALNGADCIYRFDLFFGSVKPTVESFHKVEYYENDVQCMIVIKNVTLSRVQKLLY